MFNTKRIQRELAKRQVLKHHPIVLENCSVLPTSAEMDVMSMSKAGVMFEYEVKVSRQDFLKDSKKKKWQHYELRVETTTPNYFSYVCPEGMINVDEIPSYAGLYYVDRLHNISEIKKPKRLHKRKHGTEKLLESVCRIMSERKYLGSCRLTYENKKNKERNERWLRATSKR